MDFFLENETQDAELEIKTTPDIELQMDKYNNDEYFIQQNIPELALFVPSIFANKLKLFYASNIDMPLLIYGMKGCGKITAILGLINNVPDYVSNLMNSDDMRKFNNIYYMKVIDNEYNKLLAYENLYYLNIDILVN